MIPTDARPLYRPLHAELLALLRSLGPDDWSRPATPAWSVRDVAAHILDGDLRRLSLQRDRHALSGPAQPPEGFASLVAFLDGLNADWIKAARRLSPRVLQDLLALSGAQVADLMESWDLEAEAFFEVAWAGEHANKAWLDIGRDFTEKWHHQQQIRVAAGAVLLTETRFLRPVIALSLLALPRVYAGRPAAEGTLVAIEIAGESGGLWHLMRGGSLWRLVPGPVARAVTTIRLDEDAAWRVFFKMIPEEEARQRIRIEGDLDLGTPFLGARAVMA